MRIAVGLTLLDDIIEVYVLDRKLDETENNRLNLETIDMMDINIFTNKR